MNGAVARAGAALGVATPVNAHLAALVDDVATNPERRTWLRGHPERLLAELSRNGISGPSAAPSGSTGGSTKG
jgi:hypothetical protein